MTKESISKWVEVVKILGQNPSIIVICPECEQENLTVTDVDNPSNSIEFERYMFCPKCNARNVLRMTHK